MAANFSISDSESDTSEEVEEEKTQTLAEGEHHVPLHLSLNLPDFRLTGPGRIRVNSESVSSNVTRDEEELGTPTDGAPFRGRSKSAPPSLWAAKKYGQRLRRMSDEFDSLMDKGEMRKVKSAGNAKQMHHSKSWWSYLFSHQEIEGENNHHDSHTPERTE